MKIFLMILAGLYILSPIDLLPEVLLGPFGLIDDGLSLLYIFSNLSSNESTNRRNRKKGGNKERVKKIGESGAKKLKEKSEEMQSLKLKLEILSDESLIGMYHKADFSVKNLAIRSLLTERGYVHKNNFWIKE